MLRTVVTSLLLAAILILAAYVAAYEMEQLSWRLPVKLATAVLVAFVSTSVALCVVVSVHIVMGGEWL